MIEKNSKLKLAIFEQDISQAELAQKTGIAESVLSMAINGRYNLKPEQKENIAETIGRDVSEIFEA